MKHVLVIQSRSRPAMIDAEQHEYLRAVAEEAALTFISSLDEHLPWDTPEEIIGNADGLIIGGSGEFFLDGGKDDDDPAKAVGLAIVKRLSPLLEYVVQTDFPTMGICFGHQLIAQAHGGAVMNDMIQKKIGTHPVCLNEAGRKDELLHTLPERFNAQYGHYDSVTILPRGALLLATGAHCNFSVLRYGANVYSFQPHPELTRTDVIQKLKNSPGYLPDHVDPETIVDESPEASLLIPRFLELIATDGSVDTLLSPRRSPLLQE